MSPDITVDEKYHQSMCMAYLKEPLLDGLCGPILEETFGHLIESGGPTEISGCIQHIQNQKMAARLLGRPGVFMVAVGTAEHDSGQIAVSNNEWGVQTTDARLVGSLTEFKTADTLLNRSLHYAQYGSYTGNLTGAIYGGWCGGSEGTAIATVAYSLIGLVIHGAMFNQHFPISSQLWFEHHPRTALVDCNGRTGTWPETVNCSTLPMVLPMPVQ